MADISFITRLFREKEGVNIEFKEKFELNKILRTICAFLNSEGGWILIGYYKNKVVGVSENINQIISELEYNVATNITPQPLVYITKETYKGKELILINVIKGSRQPYSLNGKYYIRKGGQSIDANPDDISLLLRTSNDYVSTWEKMNTTEATIDDLQLDEVKQTINDANKLGKGKSLPNTSDGFLGYFQLQDFNIIRNGAMVLFGKDPIKFLPQCRIRITVMPYGKIGNQYSDVLIIEDNLFASFNRLREYFIKNFPLINEFEDNWERIIRKKYPMDAIDEAITNAMVHRDYADISGEITINIYKEKIEIINSGEIPADIVSKKNKIVPHHSVLRNPIIAHMFYLRGKMEKLGRGLSLIKEIFEKQGLRTPEWTSQSGYTTLTLYSVSEQLNDRMKEFLGQLEKGNSFTSKEYEKYFSDNISERTARNDISVLVKSKYIIKEEQGPATIYKRTNKELPDIAG